jgi:2',3'-cyclic-nucleotide 2'-phosphodiesterase (5'-nucleotidase family)
MRVRWGALFLVLAALALGAAGCGGDDEAGDDDAAGETGAEVTEPVTLTFWQTMNEEETKTLQEIVDRWEAALDEALGEVIGFRVTEWDVLRDHVRSQETGMANYITDTIRESVGADIGLQNGGGIRGDRIYEAGDITRRDIVEMLPFDNYMVVKEIPGHRVLDLLDATLERGDGARLQLSGVEMVYDLSRPDGERVLRGPDAKVAPAGG